MNYNCFFISITFLSMLLCSFTASAKDRPLLKEIKGTLTLGTQYDDNTNEYSEKYIDRFKHLQDSGRFHITSIDDDETCAKLGLEGKFYFFKKRQTSFNASAFYKFYANNSIDRFWRFNVGLGQQVARKTYLHATYTLVPSVYLYHFRDKDWVAILGKVPETFQPFGYSKDVFSFRLLQYFGKATSITGEFEYERYYYNEHYTEYDSKEFVGSLRGSHTINDMFTLTCGYNFAFNDALGYDGDIPGETKESSDDADNSFLEHRGFLGIQWFFPEIFGKTHSISIDGALHYRDYTTEKDAVLDITHSGRFDYTAFGTAAYIITLAKPLAIQVGYGRTQRWVGSSHARNNEYLKQEKNYSKNVTSFTLQYTIGR